MSEKVNSKRINLEHITRIEGHGNICIDIENDKIKEIQWQVSEAPRFFENIVVGKSFEQIPSIVSRICGICSIGHTLASLKAIENALSVNITEQTLLLRKLALHGENIQSHILHLGYLVSPDLFGVGSIIPLAKSQKELLLNIIDIHKLANEMSDTICGRTTHPVSMVVGGFSKLPCQTRLNSIKSKLIKGIKILEYLAYAIHDKYKDMLDFQRETEYIALSCDDEYALYDGQVASSDTGLCGVDEYLNIVNEYIVPYSTAKFAKHNRSSYMVGALARFNINSCKLLPEAKAIADIFGLKSPCYNPFMNNIAQLVEIVHSFVDSINIIDNLLSKHLTQEDINIKIISGNGIGAVEVPRGILFHEYLFDDNGICIKANCVIPTNQNHGNIQKDLEVFTPNVINLPDEELKRKLSMLVRAYDPCISCSTHLIDIKINKK